MEFFLLLSDMLKEFIRLGAMEVRLYSLKDPQPLINWLFYFGMYRSIDCKDPTLQL